MNNNKINLLFFPSINGISFGKDCEIVVGQDYNRHLIGDIFYNGECIGYYNPLFQKNKTYIPDEFIRIEDKNLVNKYANYKSIFAYSCNEKNQKTGLIELMKDLEYLTYLYSFMNKVQKNDNFENVGLIGLINNDFMQCFKIKDSVNMTEKEVIDFYNTNISDYGKKLNDKYPIKVFRNLNDFKITTSIF